MLLSHPLSKWPCWQIWVSRPHKLRRLYGRPYVLNLGTHDRPKTNKRLQGGNAERAVEWLFSHPDDMGEDSAPAASSSSTPAQPEIGGTKEAPVRYALKAFISHKGPSVHSGHYVAHIRVGDEWVLFNDEKVVKADAESVRDLKRFAYLYFLERV